MGLLTDWNKTNPLITSVKNDTHTKELNTLENNLSDDEKKVLLSDTQLLGEFAQLIYTSRYALKIVTQYPEIRQKLLIEQLYQQSIVRTELTGTLQSIVNRCESLVDLKKQLRHFRHMTLLHILWRDVNQYDSTKQSLSALSWLADCCLSEATNWLFAQLSNEFGIPKNKDGNPMSLMVIAMGKLGGFELNFSSDIDVIFVYEHNGETEGGKRKITHEQFFTRLAQSVVQCLNDVTEDGFVYRVDTRLRPFGDSGPLVTSIAALEVYIHGHARAWERYAMIKARAVTGSEHEQQQFNHVIQPFVYRRYLDFAAIDSLRTMKHKIENEGAHKDLEAHIKLGRGGIRDIEFIIQALQLIHGGKKTSLQTQKISQAFIEIAKLSLMAPDELNKLSKAYYELRRIENHIQALEDKQTHHIPTTDSLQAQLALSLSFDSWKKLMSHVKAVRKIVSEAFSKFTFSPALDKDAHTKRSKTVFEHLWENIGINENVTANTLPEDFVNALNAFKQSRSYRQLSNQALQYVDIIVPQCIEFSSGKDNPLETFARLTQLIKIIAGRTAYLALLAENQTVINLLSRLFSASSWVAEQVTNTPALLDELLDPRRLFEPLQLESLSNELSNTLKQVEPSDDEAVYDALRQFKHAQHLRVAATEITGHNPLMKVSDFLTFTAISIIRETLTIAWRDCAAKYGHPSGTSEANPGVAIIGYGKLGGIELSYSSDLDIVFLMDDTPTDAAAEKTSTVDRAVFFQRLVQRFLHICHTTTRFGKLYEIDMRLRPSGASGLMVSSITAFKKYQAEKAWVWEHQALVRASFVAGDVDIGQQFEQIRQETLSQTRQVSNLKQTISDMRDKILAEKRHHQTDTTHLKYSPGTITDIEFIVQFIVLSQAHTHPDLSTYTDNIRLLEMFAIKGLITASDKNNLINAYQYYRHQLHLKALKGEPAVVTSDNNISKMSDEITAIWSQLFSPN